VVHLVIVLFPAVPPLRVAAILAATVIAAIGPAD
jgi:hypothetical protein